MTDQVKLLNDLVRELKKEKKTKDEAIASLHAAGILTKQGNFTKNFSNLKRACCLAK